MKRIFIFTFLVFTFFMFSNVYAAVKTGTYKIVSALDENKILVGENGNIFLGDASSAGVTTWDVFSDGFTYSIKSHDDNNYSVDLYGGKLGNLKNIALYKTNSTKAQKWYLNYVKGYYYITSSLGNYNIDVYGANNTIGANISLYKANTTNAQKWKFVRVDESEKTLEEGTYIIRSKINNDNVVDLYRAYTKNATNIQMYPNNFTWGQIWKIKYDNGYYSMTTYLADNKAVDVYGDIYKNKTNVSLYQKNSSNAQKFIINSNDDNTYSIRSYDGLWSFDVAGGSTKPETNLWLYMPNVGNAQKFIFEKVNIDPIETGYYTINFVADNTKAIGVNNSAIFNGKNVDLRTHENHNTTKWYIQKISDDIYNISISDNKKYFLSLKGNNVSSGTNVELNNTNNGNAQRWCIRKNDDETYKIMNVKSGMALDVYGANNSEGTNVIIYKPNSTAAQKFTFTKTEVSPYQMAYDNGRYEIKSVINNRLLLDVNGAKKVNGTNVQMYTTNGTSPQNWRLEYIGEGAYIVRSYVNPNLVLTAAGTNAVSSKYTQSDYQKWYFDKSGDITAIINMGNGKYLNIDSKTPANMTNVSLSDNRSTTSEFVLSKSSSVLKYKGVDLSTYNNVTSWSSLADSIDFAIIRAGFGEEKISNGKDQYEDNKYIENVKKCEENNIPYALYFYSYANKVKSSDKPSYNTTNIDSADNEAAHMIKLMKKITNSGYYPTLKTNIFYDQEETSYVYNKVKKYYGESDGNNPKTRKMLTDIINDFCGTMNNNNYTCGIYSNSNWLTGRVNVSDVAKKHTIWVAEWPGSTTFNQALSNKPEYSKTPYKIWQFTSSGNVPGISGRVDLDIGYDIFE